jgi:DNA-binding MarR family transcriptional regulator
MGLKSIHARMFMTICKHPGISQDQIARRLRFDKSTVARQVELLEDKGYLTRSPSEADKRVLCVYPTEAMLAVYPALAEAMQSWEDALLADLTPEEKDQFIALLHRVCAGTDREG